MPQTVNFHVQYPKCVQTYKNLVIITFFYIFLSFDTWNKTAFLNQNDGKFAYFLFYRNEFMLA